MPFLKPKHTLVIGLNDWNWYDVELYEVPVLMMVKLIYNFIQEDNLYFLYDYNPKFNPYWFPAHNVTRKYED